tara:strand:+ start:60 stop:260 length:201 start_codon:yes stop_codon:yes gene_type:complete
LETAQHCEWWIEKAAVKRGLSHQSSSNFQRSMQRRLIKKLGRFKANLLSLTKNLVILKNGREKALT